MRAGRRGFCLGLPKSLFGKVMAAAPLPNQRLGLFEFVRQTGDALLMDKALPIRCREPLVGQEQELLSRTPSTFSPLPRLL